MCETCNSLRPELSLTENRALVEIQRIEAILKQDPYDLISAELQDLLLVEWDAAAREAIAEAIRTLEGRAGLASEADLDAMIETLGNRLGVTFGAGVAPVFHEFVIQAYAQGLEDFSGVLNPTFSLVDNVALAWMDEHNTYWIGNHFDSQVRERLQKAGAKVIGQRLARLDAGEVFAAEFGSEINKSASYWEGLSNHVTTRSREFAHVSAYERAHAKTYEIVAVVDDRTTDICLAMDGRVFSVQAAQELRDNLLATSDPEEVREVAPWIPESEVEEKIVGVDTEELPDGLALPPYHFNCRTRTVLRS